MSDNEDLDDLRTDFDCAEKEMPWPRKGDVLFKYAEDWQNNACINFMSDSWDLYATGYKRAADILVAQAIKDSVEIDYLVYPIVFMYRQSLELSLKIITRDGLKFLDEKGDFSTIHKLDELWKKCKSVIIKIYPDDPVEDLINFEEGLTQFSEADPNSFAFRYPESKDKKQSLPPIYHINIRNLSEAVGRLYTFLDSVSEGICVKLDEKSDMESGY